MSIQFIFEVLYVYIFTFVKQWINFREICEENFTNHNFPFISSLYSSHKTVFIDIIFFFFIQISESYNVPTL